MRKRGQPASKSSSVQSLSTNINDRHHDETAFEGSNHAMMCVCCHCRWWLTVTCWSSRSITSTKQQPRRRLSGMQQPRSRITLLLASLAPLSLIMFLSHQSMLRPLYFILELSTICAGNAKVDQMCACSVNNARGCASTPLTCASLDVFARLAIIHWRTIARLWL